MINFWLSNKPFRDIGVFCGYRDMVLPAAEAMHEL